MARKGEGQYGDGAALCAAVETNGDLLRVAAEDVRRAEGTYGKLGSHVNGKLFQWLENQGMGVVGGELPRYQHQEAVLYRSGTTMAKVIKAVEEPSGAGDRILRQLVSDDGSQDKLERIRGILGDD